MKKILNGSLVLVCLCLLTQFAWASQPCPVTRESDGSSSNSTTLRGAAYLLENATKQCSASGFPDGDYFGQYVYFETATYSGIVDTITLSSAIEFDMASGTAVIGNPSSYSLSDTTADMTFDPSGYSDLDSVLVLIHGEAVAGASPFQCSSTSHDVYLRSMIILTDSLKETEFWADSTTNCIKNAGDVHVCTADNYDSSKDPRTDASWCADSTTNNNGTHPGIEITPLEFDIKYADSDGDGYGDPNAGRLCIDGARRFFNCDGYVDDKTDCDDTVATTHPGAAEICDEIDNDCDGQIDEDFDTDGDGYSSCTDDCDDTNAAINPGATEICGDGLDNDCDGSSDPVCAADDADGDGYTEDQNDCNDNDASINPGETEICDGIDNNCDGNVDGGGVCDDTDADGDGYTSVETGGTDCNDNDASIHPDATETCGDGVDQDCDGTDAVCVLDDIDGDGYTNVETGGTDCNDNDYSINPGASETCGDTIDQDCSGADVACEICDDGLDNDADEAFDCDDSDCSIDALCTIDPNLTPNGEGEVTGGAMEGITGCSLVAAANQGGSMMSLMSMWGLIALARLFRKK